MAITYYPDQAAVRTAMGNDDPLLLLVAHDGASLIVSNVDDALENAILLKRSGHSELEIDRYFRVVANRSGADWTFVCPGDYRGIADRPTRMSRFHSDGIERIRAGLDAIGCPVEINIPPRYRRHLGELTDG